MKVKISRMINGISINGDEYICDKNNKVIIFKSIKYAKKWLNENGIKDFRGLNFEEVLK